MDLSRYNVDALNHAINWFEKLKPDIERFVQEILESISSFSPERKNVLKTDFWTLCRLSHRISKTDCCDISSSSSFFVRGCLSHFLSLPFSLSCTHTHARTHNHTHSHALTHRSGASYHHLFGTLSSANGKSCYSKLHAFQSVKKMSPTGDQIAFLKWSLRGKRKEGRARKTIFLPQTISDCFHWCCKFERLVIAKHLDIK